MTLEATGLQLIVHPDNHIHDGMTHVVKTLIAAAEREEIVLLCEGNVCEFNETEKRSIKLHGVQWQGESQYINGIETMCENTSRLWANATRLAFNTGRSESKSRTK